ncbi:MAG: hypothetical protein IPH16_02020 [Haliscomenobacter sp.]|nr:hypothetical protein [Haliscomenobacter sp.]MBK7475442.1 hypothetical protein [Haliscomenobacter sp.]MBK8878025.1 hypothetical protein [Haliscomenobacter sp.]
MAPDSGEDCAHFDPILGNRRYDVALLNLLQAVCPDGRLSIRFLISASSLGWETGVLVHFKKRRESLSLRISGWTEWAIFVPVVAYSAPPSARPHYGRDEARRLEGVLVIQAHARRGYRPNCSFAHS